MKVKLVKAFSVDPKFGNPAGVLLDAEGVADKQKQAIAAELGFSESAFVEKSDKADFRVRFFSPTQEVGFCGHATVATFRALMEAGVIKPSPNPAVVTQETNIGVLEVQCFGDGKVTMRQQQPKFSETFEDKLPIASLVGLEEVSLLSSPIQIVSTGGRQLIVPIKNLESLQAIKPNLEAIKVHSKRFEYAGVCAITPHGFTENGDIATRNFAPKVGIDEDAATGIAAGAIGWYCNKYLFRTTKQFVVEQGFGMNMSSEIMVNINNGTQVGGYAIIFGEQEF